jgi:two-component system, response regulator YesN
VSYRILVADDQLEICRTLKDFLLKSRPIWEVETALGGFRARQQLCQRRYDVALVDVYMPEVGGLEVLRTVQQKQLPLDVVMMTGMGSIDLAVQAMKEGAADFVTKPFVYPQLIEKVEELIERRRPTANRLARRLDQYVETHMANAELRLGTLCQSFGISERYACKLFRDHLGQTFRRRLNAYRIDHGKKLLRTTVWPVGRIAVECGFKSQSRFGEVFRKLEGMTPRGCRRNEE